jgi:hypothetical protein
MKELKEYIFDDVDTFREKFNGSKIATEILEAMPGFGTWLDHKRNAIREYYLVLHKEAKLSLSYCKNSFKIRLTFLPDGELQLNLEYSQTQNTTIREKKVMKEYKSDPGYVYFLESEFGWKIGKTRDLKRRFRIFEVKLPFKFAVRFTVKTPLMNDLEALYHNYFKEKHINGEWYLITTSDIMECVSKTPELRLKRYHQECSHIIEKKYLSLIND